MAPAVVGSVEGSFLGALPPATVEILLDRATILEVPAGRLLGQPGDRPAAALVVDGLVRLFHVSPAGRQVDVRYVSGGESMIAGALSTPAAVRAQAITGVQLLLLDPAVLSCPTNTELIVRYKAPSCWDGRHRDSPDHKSHMAYPVDGACSAGHPVAVPMLEFKIAYPGTKDNADLRLASGRGYSWHADFFAAWDPKVQEALVTQCINGGGQCDARGHDARQPQRGRVLNAKGRLIARR